MNRKERMLEVYTYLRDNGFVHTQKDLAKAIGSTPPNISKMLKGSPSVLTDNICVRIQKAFKMISSDWLISGEGEMIVNSNTATETSSLDHSSLINATIAAMDSTIASLKRELVSKEKSTNEILHAKEDVIVSLKHEIDAKDELIKSLRQQLDSLCSEIESLKEKHTNNYQFPIGVSENNIATMK